MTDDQLGETISNMDGLAQGGLNGIEAMAFAGKLAFESPSAYDHPHLIADLFDAILAAARDTRNVINCEAESVGCNCPLDAVWQRRWDALKQSEKRRASLPRGTAASADN